LVGVALAALAGAAIGALRPLGRWSELLLLPFAPWLLVGSAPLVLAGFVDAQHSGKLESWFALIPPTWLVVPALFLFTVLFRGQEGRRRAMVAAGMSPRTALVRAMLPALPMIGLAFAATWLVQAQDLSWPFTMASGPERATSTVLMFQHLGQYARSDASAPFSSVLPVVVVVLSIVVLAAAQLSYLDRIAVRVGGPPQGGV
jgi:hypothetical protein